MNCTRLFSPKVNSLITRSVTNYKNNSPRTKKTTCILSNGATISYWTSLPHAKVWRSEVDTISNPPNYIFDSIEDIQEQRKKDLEAKFSSFRK